MNRTPKYRKNTAGGIDYAFVEIEGERYALGRYDDPQSKEKYRRLLAEYFTGLPLFLVPVVMRV